MAGENRIRFRADIDDKVTSKLGKIRDNFDRVGKSKGAQTLLQGVGLGAGIRAFDLIGSAARGAIDGITASIDASRDMTETLSKSKVVFGVAARDIERFGDSAATSMGLSKRSAIEAAATFGNFFTGLGQGERQAADMSKRLVGLAGDLASFNNMDPTETLDKLRAGLAGEAEPLRRVGVFLNEAKVRAKAMELGLSDAHGELSEGAKVLARYHIILDETKTAQGDFARTSMNLANQQRTAAALLADQQAELGKQWEPQALQFTKLQVDVVRGLSDIDDAVRESQLTIRSWFGDTGLAARKAGEAAERTQRWADSMMDARDGAVEAKRPVDDMAGSMFTFGSASQRAYDRTRKLFDLLSEGTQTLIDEHFDPIEQHQDLVAAKAERSAARRELAAGKAGAKERRELRMTITEADRQIDTLSLDLLKAGELSDKEKKQWIADLQERARKGGAATQRYVSSLIREINRLDGMQANISIIARVRSVFGGGGYGAMGDPPKERRASGGPVLSGQAYTVGERGPETLVMGNQSGTIIPNGAGGSVNFTYAPTYSSASPAEAQEFSRMVVPGLVREMRRQGVLA
jgi:hypothetical protein